MVAALCACAEQSGERTGSEREGESERERRSASSKNASEEAKHVVGGRHTHRPWWSQLSLGYHALPLWGISPRMWRTPKWPTWGAVLDRFWADLGVGPETKFDAHMKLYDFYYGYLAIRATD
jgi:hypothetical protein